MRSRHPAIVTTRSSMAALNRFVEAGAILIFILVARRSSAVTHTVSLFFKKTPPALENSKKKKKKIEKRERERERERESGRRRWKSAEEKGEREEEEEQEKREKKKRGEE